MSCCFLLAIVTGAFFTTVPTWVRRKFARDPDAGRPGVEEERRRAEVRGAEVKEWEARRKQVPTEREGVELGLDESERLKLEAGGEDELKNDIRYYANRVGLEAEELRVETEDGFILELWHIWDPEDPPAYPHETLGEKRAVEEEDEEEEGDEQEDVLDFKHLPKPRMPLENQPTRRKPGKPGRRRYPVLLMHGLLQSAGAFCVNDSDSLAFYLTRW